MVEVEKRLAHLAPFFAGHRIARITGADVTRYVEHRQRQEAANGTINRELAILTKMLRLAYENQKLVRLPVIHKLEEAAPRQGFFERDQYEAVRKRLRADLQLAVTIGYTYGWRMPSEVLMLERRQVDVEAGTLRLDPGSTKNDDGRLVYLAPELAALVTAQLERACEGAGKEPQAHHPVPVPPPAWPPARRAHRRLPQGLGDGVRQRRRRRLAAPRPAPDGRAQPRAGRRPALARDEGHRPPDRERLQSLRDRERRGPSRRDGATGGHNHGHNSTGWGRILSRNCATSFVTAV
jgi:integrase